MNITEKACVLTYHTNRRSGSDSYAQGYRNDDSQRLRFEAICEWGDLSGMGVLDMGCGYGDFVKVLTDRYHDTHYLGLDFHAKFIEQSRLRHQKNDKAQFLCTDFLNAKLPEMDFIIASGSLNYRSDNPGHPWQCINRMWYSANCGVAFNLLDSRHFEAGNFLCGYAPYKVLDYCLALNPKANIIQGYLPDDFTIFMYK